MNTDSQLMVPESFLALHCRNGRLVKLSPSEVAQRYETCEDLANILALRARDAIQAAGATAQDVHNRCIDALAASPQTVDEREGQWIATRIAELLGQEGSALLDDQDATYLKGVVDACVRRK